MTYMKPYDIRPINEREQMEDHSGGKDTQIDPPYKPESTQIHELFLYNEITTYSHLRSAALSTTYSGLPLNVETADESGGFSRSVMSSGGPSIVLEVLKDCLIW